MNTNTLKSLTRKVAELGEHFGVSLSEQRLASYVRCLAEENPEDVEAACEQMKRESRFFPSVAEILEATHGPTMTIDEKADMAWLHLRRLTGIRAYNPHALECPVTKRCFEMLGGYHSFGVWDYEAQEEFKRRRFVSLYKTLYGIQSADGRPVFDLIGMANRLPDMPKAIEEEEHDYLAE